MVTKIFVVLLCAQEAEAAPAAEEAAPAAEEAAAETPAAEEAAQPEAEADPVQVY